MIYVIVTFCGHRNVCNKSEIKVKILKIIDDLISEGTKTFLLGGYGEFDIMAANAVNDLKINYPYIKSIIVLAYIDKKYDIRLYDFSEYPPIENIPQKICNYKKEMNIWWINLIQLQHM